MTNTERRTLLKAIAAAPVVGVAATAAAAPTGAVLADMSEEELLAHGATISADPEFARLCAAALTEWQRSDAAWRTQAAASEAAGAETPPYPEGLCYRSRYERRGPNAGETVESDERHEPRPAGEVDHVLWGLVQRHAEAAGVCHQTAEAQLRAEYADWKRAADAAKARHRTRELEEEAEAVADIASAAVRDVLAHPALSADVLLVKLHLHADHFGPSFKPDEWQALIDDVARVTG
jgi:hypothetical protein